MGNIESNAKARDRQRKVEQRMIPDRRGRPTTLWHTLRRNGQRKGFRRTNEGGKAFLDCSSSKVVALVVWVMVASAFDALFTPLRLSEGFSEANPIMGLALAYGPVSFVGIKMALSAFGSWLLAAHQQYLLAYLGLCGLAILYVGVMGVHGILMLTGC